MFSVQEMQRVDRELSLELLPFSLFFKYIILQKNWSCWYPIWKISISIVYNVGFSLLPGRICVNEDFYDLLAQVITFHIILKSVIFEKKTKREIAT